MNKENLQKKLIEIQLISIGELKEKISAAHSGADIDESDTIDPEDLSHQTESIELKNLFQQQLVKAENELDSLKKIDFSKKETAVPGALISTENFHFFLGFATVPFDFEGKRIVGVSVESPIYPEIKGKRTGDTFSYSEKKYTIIEIN